MGGGGEGDRGESKRPELGGREEEEEMRLKRGIWIEVAWGRKIAGKREGWAEGDKMWEIGVRRDRGLGKCKREIGRRSVTEG